jgi:hypothetical protein
MEDLLCQVEAEASTSTAREKATKLLALLPPGAYRAAVFALATALFTARTQTSMRRADRTIEEPSRRGRPPGVRNPATTKHLMHASPKILAASNAWNDWLATQVPIPGTTIRIPLGDMTVEQLTKVADCLYDAHEQIHRLADAMISAGVTTAKELPPEAAHNVLEAA